MVRSWRFERRWVDGTVPKRPESAAVGIVGGGQLARMLAAAAAELNLPLLVQTPRVDDPAVALASDHILAPLDDVDATRALARRCRAISFENEWLALERLELLEAEGVCFLPDLQSLRPLLSKRAQRRLLDELNLNTVRWAPLEAVLPPPQPAVSASHRPADGNPPPAPVAWSEPACGPAPPSARLVPPGPRLPEGFQFPVIAKVSEGGYDGKGIRRLNRQRDLDQLLAEVDPGGWLLEELVPFERELALTACRDAQGNVVCFPLVETHQHQQVCDWVLYPAPVGHSVQLYARNVAVSLLTALSYVGVLSIEFFWGPAGLQVNELAPRTHNSGHYTIEACRTSQFAQQVRIVAGLPMGSPEPCLAGALMVNLLAFNRDEAAHQRAREALAALEEATLHWYGKKGLQPGRKLGHLTLPLQASGHEQREAERVRQLERIRQIWPLPSASTP
ncbi:MAG: ATP-grasp domain-containing protein [Synechococcaceae cyanobacterium]|nr:ATP-grasp domain-containing protein [Synechococcaceae cyanobacterium]